MSECDGLRMEERPQDVSYAVPRDSSLCFKNIQYLKVTRTNLLSLLEEEIGGKSEDSARHLQVYLRIKPLPNNVSLLGPPQEEVLKVKNSETLIARTTKDPVSHQFQFTKIFTADSSQEQIYEESVHALVKKFINGQNCLLFAYGTSSAGKTYTIQGTPQEPGILPRAINVLFNSIKGRECQVCRFKPDMVNRIVQLDEKSINEELAYKQKIMTWSPDKFVGSDQSHSSRSTASHISEKSLEKRSEMTNSSLDSHDFGLNQFRDMQMRLNNTVINIDGLPNTVFSIWVSFAEIYNENIYDLLEPIATKGQKRQHLSLGQDGRGQVYIKGLRHVWVSSGEEAYQVMLYGQHNLKFASTALNSLSSRSHCIFTIKLLQHLDTDQPKLIGVSMFSFCDLAGTERVKNTLNVGERLKESQNINSSLHVLGRCLMTIRENQTLKHKKLIPFRDSKLTRLFQRALTGKESIMMIVNVNPTPVLRDETFNVLTFSAIAKQIILQQERKKKRGPRSSRFSQYVYKSHLSSTRVDDSTSSILSIRESDALRAEIETLTNLVDKLKEQVQMERKERQAIESRVRQELCDDFLKRFMKAQETWEAELESTQLRYEQMAEWRVSKLEEHYQKKQSRKRARDDDSEEEDSNPCDEDDTAYLTQRLNAEKELHRLAKQELSDELKKSSKLTMDLAHCQEALKNAEKIIEAVKANGDGQENSLSLELHSQLNSIKEELKLKDKRIEELEGILEDGKEDFVQLESEYNEIEKERNDLEAAVLMKDSENKMHLDTLRSMQQKLEQQAKQLDLKDERIENLEKDLKEFQKKLQEKEESIKKELIDKQKALEDEIKEKEESLKKEFIDKQKALEDKIKELEEELKATREDNCDLQKDFMEIEKERDSFAMRLIEKDTEIDDHLDNLREKQKLIDQKDEAMKKLEKQLEQVKLECQNNHLKNEDNLQLQIENLTKKVKEAEDSVLKLQEKEQIRIREIQELNGNKDSLEEKLHNVEKAEKQTIKDMIRAEEEKKKIKSILTSTQSENAELKVKLQSYKNTADLVSAMKAELDAKSSRFKELELENEVLKESLGTKELEMKHFKENRDEVIKRYEDLLQKERQESEKHKREVSAYQKLLNTPTPNKQDYEAKLQKLQDTVDKRDNELRSLRSKYEELQTKCKDNDDDESYGSGRKGLRTRRKVPDENVHPALQDSSDKRCYNDDDDSYGSGRKGVRTRRKVPDENVHPALQESNEKRHMTRESRLQAGCNQKEKTKSKSRHRRLFSDIHDDLEEIPAVEVDEKGSSLHPERLLRSRRM